MTQYVVKSIYSLPILFRIGEQIDDGYDNYWVEVHPICNSKGITIVKYTDGNGQEQVVSQFNYRGTMEELLGKEKILEFDNDGAATLYFKLNY